MDERAPRPRLRVYLAFIAVIVAISGAAVWLFGGQTPMILMNASGTV
jgi:hypothetical protein